MIPELYQLSYLAKGVERRERLSNAETEVKRKKWPDIPHCSSTHSSSCFRFVVAVVDRENEQEIRHMDPWAAPHSGCSSRNAASVSNDARSWTTVSLSRSGVQGRLQNGIALSFPDRRGAEPAFRQGTRLRRPGRPFPPDRARPRRVRSGASPCSRRKARRHTGCRMPNGSAEVDLRDRGEGKAATANRAAAKSVSMPESQWGG